METCTGQELIDGLEAIKPGHANMRQFSQTVYLDSIYDITSYMEEGKRANTRIGYSLPCNRIVDAIRDISTNKYGWRKGNDMSSTLAKKIDSERARLFFEVAKQGPMVAGERQHPYYTKSW